MEHLAGTDAIRRDVVGSAVEQITWMDNGRKKLCVPLLVVSPIVSPNKTEHKIESLGKAVSSTPQEEAASSADDAFL
eukprot:1766157-Ditylum_brightwellii.AAC.1